MTVDKVATARASSRLSRKTKTSYFWGGTRGSQQHPPRNDRPPHRLGKRYGPIVVVPHSCRPRAVAGTAAQISACPDGGRGQKLPKYGGDDILWGSCRPGRQVSADPYSGSMRRTNCGSQTRSWMTPSSRGAVVRRYFSSSGVAFANTQGTARRMWR